MEKETERQNESKCATRMPTTATSSLAWKDGAQTWGLQSPLSFLSLERKALFISGSSEKKQSFLSKTPGFPTLLGLPAVGKKISKMPTGSDF